MSELDDHTPASAGESVLLAAQALATSSPINVASTACVVPAPTTSQFSRELEDIRVANGTSKHKRRAEHHSEISHLRHYTRDTGFRCRPGSGVS